MHTNDSNQTLRFSRSWHEATGERIHSSQFESHRLPTVAEVMASLSVVALILIVGLAAWIR